MVLNADVPVVKEPLPSDSIEKGTDSGPIPFARGGEGRTERQSDTPLVLCPSGWVQLIILTKAGWEELSPYLSSYRPFSGL